MFLSFCFVGILIGLRELWLRAPRSVIGRFAFEPGLEAAFATVQSPIEKI
jgi:hypothetical protein